MELLAGKFVAILTENGFEEVELTSPKRALEEAGAIVHIVSPQKEKVLAWDHDHWSIDLPVDVHLSKARPEDYDALVLQGGVINPDETGMNTGREMTSYFSIKTDLINAGANWVDKEVVVDNGLVTSRSPKDLEAFNKKM